MKAGDITRVKSTQQMTSSEDNSLEKKAGGKPQAESPIPKPLSGRKALSSKKDSLSIKDINRIGRILSKNIGKDSTKLALFNKFQKQIETVSRESMEFKNFLKETLKKIKDTFELSSSEDKDFIAKMLEAIEKPAANSRRYRDLPKDLSSGDSKKPTDTIDFKYFEKLFSDLKSEPNTKTSGLPFGIEQMRSEDFKSRPSTHFFSLKAKPNPDMSESTSIETLFESLGFSEASAPAASSKPLPRQYEDIIARTLVKSGISGEGVLYKNGKIDMVHKDGSKIPLEDLMQGTDDHLDEPDVPKPFSYGSSS